MKYLFLLCLAITPFTTIMDSFFWTILGYKTGIISPTWLRGLDDILLAMLLGFSFLLLYKKKYFFNKIYLTLIAVILISFFISGFLGMPLLVLSSGLKWSIPIFLIGTFYFIKENDMKFLNEKIILFLIVFAYLNFFLQGIQSFTMSSYYGPTLFGFSQRTIGFFREPNSLSLFSVFSIYFIYYYMKSSVHKKVIIFMLLASLIVSGSFTPIIALFLVFLLLIFRFNFKLLVTIFPIALVLIFLIIPEVSTRPGLINSFIGRFDIIIDNLTLNNVFFSPHFGWGTNTAVLLTGYTTLPESTTASLLINIGLLGVFLFYMLLLKIGITSTKAFVFVTLMVSVSFTNVIFESYPVNFLFAFELAYLLKQQKRHIMDNSNV